MASVLNLVQLALIAVWALVLARIVISWVDPAGRNQISVFLDRVTEPILAPVRRLLPPSAALECSR